MIRKKNNKRILKNAKYNILKFTFLLKLLINLLLI